MIINEINRVVNPVGSNFKLTNKKLEFKRLEPFSYMHGKDICTIWLPDQDTSMLT
jgi:hypothetical protein